MLSFEAFWLKRLPGAAAPSKSAIPGWQASTTAAPGFVEPTLTLLEGDPSSAKLIIIAAPGAVGKSSYGRTLAAQTNLVFVDLARTTPLGGHFFTGGVTNAFGFAALNAVDAGKLGLVVDALDEAQMRAGTEGYEAGLLDLAQLASLPNALPAVLLGRALAAEDAYLTLASAGFSACLLQIEFFDAAQASSYLTRKLPVVASRSPRVAAVFEDHQEKFYTLAEQTRARLMEVAGAERVQFAGYAPVLDAICEFTLDESELNPQARLSRLNNTSQIELIHDITASILVREQGKVVEQFKERHSDLSAALSDSLYSPSEQLGRVAQTLFGGPEPTIPKFETAAQQVTYIEMVDRFSPQHPFVSGGGKASNPVFAAYVVAWALMQDGYAPLARKVAQANPSLMSGIVFELYTRNAALAKAKHVPLADVGILYQALNSQILPGQRVSLEIEDDSNGIDVSFEILERVDPKTNVAQQGATWGPFPSDDRTALELHSPFSNVYVNAPIIVELGDGIVQEIGAPTEFDVEAISISAKQVLVQGASDAPKETQTVSLFAATADCQGVQQVTTRDAVLAVSWPDAEAFPWNSYVAQVPSAPQDVTFMRRRLRKILTAFRSHSKGALVRLAAKINHARMTKDARGRALVDKLVADKILVPFDGGKFYSLDPDRMGQLLGVDYHGLAQSRFTPQCDSYLADISARVREN